MKSSAGGGLIEVRFAIGKTDFIEMASGKLFVCELESRLGEVF